jgi:hypothetical protein
VGGESFLTVSEPEFATTALHLECGLYFLVEHFKLPDFFSAHYLKYSRKLLTRFGMRQKIFKK